MSLFNQTVFGLPAGKQVDAVVLRKNKELTLKVTPEIRPDLELKPKEIKQWGICAREMTFMEAKELKRANQDGVLVDSVRPGGPSDSAKPGLTTGDIIIEVNGKPVKDVKALESITKTNNDSSAVLVGFERGAQKLITVIKLGTPSLEDPGREVKKAYLPVDTQVLSSDLAEALGIDGYKGIRVSYVYPKSTAEKAGLLIGDIITKVENETISTSSLDDVDALPAMVRQYNIGSTVNLSVIRNKDELVIPVVLEESKPLPREMKKYRNDDFEFTSRDLAFQDKLDQKLSADTNGVYVHEIKSGGLASIAQLRVGDIIQQVDDHSINNVDDLQEILQKIAEQKPQYVVFRVRRGIVDSFIQIETDWQKPN